MTRGEFRTAYRFARLVFGGHKFAAYALLKSGIDLEAQSAALACGGASVWRSGIDCARTAASTGRSFKTAIRLHLRAVRMRHQSGYRPATKFVAVA